MTRSVAVDGRRRVSTSTTPSPTVGGRDPLHAGSRLNLASLALALVAAAVALALLVVVGRWEARRHERAEIANLRRALALVGPLDNRSLDAYRVDIDFKFDCLLYRRGPNPYALELCFDRSGRLAEAIDRRSGKAEIASLREHPAASTIRVDRAEVVMLLKRLGAAPPRGGWR